jgi:hypothetical protein
MEIQTMFVPISKTQFNFTALGKIAKRDITSAADRLAKSGTLAHDAVCLTVYTYGQHGVISIDSAVQTGILSKLALGAIVLARNHADAALILSLTERFQVIYEETDLVIYLQGTVSDWLNLQKALAKMEFEELAKSIGTFFTTQGLCKPN